MADWYENDATGRRVLVGLTADETEEFERLDAALPYDGELVWPDIDLPLLPMEERWLELWNRHANARDRKTG